ncbi:MAG: hypothetical protein JST00_01715 [Deltaproteobacteria bacterium]|nr:hypothetical protein [Deltaproteobacteria bacterium]
MNAEVTSLPATRPEVPRRRSPDSTPTIGWTFAAAAGGQWPVVEAAPDTVRMPERTPKRTDAVITPRTPSFVDDAWVHEPTLVSIPIHVAADLAPRSPSERTSVADTTQTSMCMAHSARCATRSSPSLPPPSSLATGHAPIRYAVVAFLLCVAITLGAPLVGRLAPKVSGSLLRYFEAARDTLGAVVSEAPPAPRAPRGAATSGARGDRAVRLLGARSHGSSAPSASAARRRPAPRVTPPPAATVASPDMLSAGIGS